MPPRLTSGFSLVARLLVDPGDFHLEDGRFRHLLAGEKEILPLQGFPLFRKTPQAVEDQAGQRVVREKIPQFNPQQFLKVIDGDEGVHQQAPVGELLTPAHLSYVVLIFDLPHELFEEILGRGKAAQDAVFVDDERHLDPFALHLLEKAAHLLPLRYEKRGPDDPGQIEFAFREDPAEEDVLRVDESDDVIHVAPVNRITGVQVFPDGPEDLLAGEFQIQGDDPGPGHHHLADARVGEFEDVFDIPVLGLGQGACFASLREDLLHLLPRNEGLSRFWRDSENGEDGAVGDREKPDGDNRDDRQEMDRPGDSQGDAVRILQADGLGGQFADNEKEIRYPEHDGGDGERLRGMLDERNGNVPQEGLEVLDGRRAADCRGKRADDGDPDLDGCQKAVRVLLDLLDQPCLRIACCGEARDMALPGGNDGQLGAGKKAVGQDQKQDYDKFIEEHVHG